ncbi:DUF2726 domain-containing protein [Lysobacter koreensis]|uniref:DUF2726 domain-containing protein n=1 Tax=Lysobacter koreensis TaxID=266122 RepID=A0ABW2YK80_9GAMM
MSSLVLLAVLAFVVFIVLAALKKKQVGGSVGFPYQPAKTLFSAAERSFLGVLDQAVGPEYRAFGKVRVADVATVKPGLGSSERQGALNRVSAKHFDFVVCRASDLSVVCAIELNDKSHSSQRAQDRDELLLRVCQAINLPLLTVPAKQGYSVQDVRVQFLSATSPLRPGVAVDA